MDTPNFTRDDEEAYQLGVISKDTYVGAGRAKKYLIKPNSESNLEFEKRQKISSLATTYRKGINSYADILFKSPLRYSENIPENIIKAYETATGTLSLNSIAKSSFKESLLMNTIYWLVWTPENTAANAKEEEEAGIRPYIEVIKRENVVRTRRDALGNLTMVIVKGSYVAEEGKYENEIKTEYRIFFGNGDVEIWRESPKKKDNYDLFDTIYLEVREMPIKEYRFEHQEDIPAFFNEASIQLQQFNIESARFGYNLKLAFPLVKSWGLLQNSQNIVTDSVDEEGNMVKLVEFQSSKGIDFPVNPETGAKLGDVTFEEVSGNSDGVLRGTSEDYTKAIVAGFISMVSDEGSGNKTVVESENERVAGESALSSASTNLEDFLNEVHILFCKYYGVTPIGEIYTNTDFVNDELDNIEYSMLTDLLAEDIIDKKQFLEELQSYGKLKTVDIDMLMDRLTAVGKQ